MRKFTGLFALLGLILLALVVSSLLRVPPAPPSVGGEFADEAVGARPPPPPTVTRAKGPPRTADAALELVLVDAVTREPVEGALVTGLLAFPRRQYSRDDRPQFGRYGEYGRIAVRGDWGSTASHS